MHNIDYYLMYMYNDIDEQRANKFFQKSYISGIDLFLFFYLRAWFVSMYIDHANIRILSNIL